MTKQRKPSFFCFNTERSTKWHTVSGVSASESLAFIALMLKVDLGGMVYASQADLAAIVKCNRATINKGLTSLIERGLVSVVPGKRAQYKISSEVGSKLA